MVPLRFAPLVALAGLGAVVACDRSGIAWKATGLAGPESVIWLAARDQFAVSSFGAYGPDAGADGSIVLLSRDGDWAEADWVTGLNDPKGLAVRGDQLLVADTTGVHVIDIATGAHTTTITLDGAEHPNDLTLSPDGTVFASDVGTGAIYAITDLGAEIWLPPGSLSRPNGIAASETTLFVGTFGTETGKGGLWSVDLATKAVTPLASEVGDIDGVTLLDGAVVFSEYATGTIYRWAEDALTVLHETSPGAADLRAEAGLLLVPNLNTGEVVAYKTE